MADTLNRIYIIALLSLLICGLVLTPVPLLADDHPGSDNAPVYDSGRGHTGLSGKPTYSSPDKTMTVDQNAARAVVNWKSFNIGEGYTTKFNQQSHWVAVNKIHDQDPSKILGTLQAGGKIVLLNPNGVMFGEGSTINVNSLVASALNFDPDAELDQLMDAQGNLKLESLDQEQLSEIINRGAINAAGGDVILIAPRVENTGEITASAGDSGEGRIVMLSARQALYNEGSGEIEYVDSDAEGAGVYNLRTEENVGRLFADKGLVAMIGKSVNQEGVVKSVKSEVGPDGSITLKRRDSLDEGAEVLAEHQAEEGDALLVARNDVTISSDAGSVYMSGNQADDLGDGDDDTVIQAEGDVEVVSDGREYGKIEVTADNGVVLGDETSLSARAGEVTVKAMGNADAPGEEETGIVMQGGSKIDVSAADGITGGAVTLETGEVVVETDDNGNIVRDDDDVMQTVALGGDVGITLQDGSVILAESGEVTLRTNAEAGETLIDLRSGSLIDASASRWDAGGTVTLTADKEISVFDPEEEKDVTLLHEGGGYIAMAAGATIDVSGRYWAADGEIDIFESEVFGSGPADKAVLLESEMLTEERRAAFEALAGKLPSLEEFQNSLSAGDVNFLSGKGEVDLAGDLLGGAESMLAGIWKPAEFSVDPLRIETYGGEEWALSESKLMRGVGGGFEWRAMSLNDFSGLQGELGDGGFTGALSFTTTGEGSHINVGEDLEIFSSSFKLIAQEGNVDFHGLLVSPEVRMEGIEIEHDGAILAIRDQLQPGVITLIGEDRVVTSKDSYTMVLPDGLEGQLDAGRDTQTLLNAMGDSKAEEEGFKLQRAQINLESQGIIHHQGTIRLPGDDSSARQNANVRMKAQRILLDSESVIDVSGLMFNYGADKLAFTIALDSTVLKDEPLQKNGFLHGKEITLNRLYGTSIGDISEALWNQKMTAAEHAVRGANIVLEAQEVIMKDGALVDISGGGYHYSEGEIGITKLYSGGDPKWIHEAPDDWTYDGIEIERDFVPAHTEGHDAGLFWVNSREVVLDGEIRAGVERSMFQTESSSDPGRRGVVEPKAGTITIGDQPALDDRNLGELIIAPWVEALTDDFGPAGEFPVVRLGLAGKEYRDTVNDAGAESQFISVISDDLINDSGAATFQVYSNTKVAIDEGAKIRLENDGKLEVMARSIEHLGEIHVPSGDVNFVLADLSSVPSGVDPLHIERVFIGPDSKIDVSGIERNLLNKPFYSPRQHHLDGGNVNIEDMTTQNREWIAFSSGASIDVSGGYLIEDDLTVHGAAAGSISMESDSIVFDGDVKGVSLEGYEGGALTLHALNVEVRQSDGQLLPDGFAFGDELAGDQRKLVFAADSLEGTGIANLNLLSGSDVRFMEKVHLEPSYRKISENTLGLITVSPEFAGATSIGIRAGEFLAAGGAGGSIYRVLRDAQGQETTGDFDATVRVSPNPDSSIALSADGLLRINSRLEALSGTIDISSEIGNVILNSGARLLAQGRTYTDKYTAFSDLTIRDKHPLDGGTITIAGNAIDILEGAEIDVSGAKDGYVHKRDSTFGVDSITTYSSPGTLKLSYLDGGLDIDPGAKIKAENESSKTFWASLELETPNLVLNGIDPEKDLNFFIDKGFEDISLKSVDSISFTGDVDAFLRGKLSIETPVIKASAEDIAVNLASEWLRFANPAKNLPQLDRTAYVPGDPGPSFKASTSFNLEAEGWLDLSGAMAVSGFEDVSLSAGNEISLEDQGYQNFGADGVVKPWVGKLAVSGSLTLDAPRVYPLTRSDFRFAANNDVTILPGSGAPDTPVYSAGGRLTVEANNIYHHGYLSAPMGRIELIAGKTLSLAGGSRIEVGGREGVPVHYGRVDGINWRMTDKKTQDPSPSGVFVQETPDKKILLEGENLDIQEGAEIDGAGGGALFSFQFFESIEGSRNPFDLAGRYVILPDNRVDRPGPTVYLEGGGGLEAGYYSILPAEYAFVDGAKVLVDVQKDGKDYVPGLSTSQEGFSLVEGYVTDRGYGGSGQGLASSTSFAVRDAKDVLEEARFNVKSLIAGDGGDLEILSSTGVVEGSFEFSRLSGTHRGVMTGFDDQLAAWGHVIDEDAVDFEFKQGRQFDRGTALFAAQNVFLQAQGDSGSGQNELHIEADRLSDAGMNIVLGRSGTTRSVTVKEGAELTAPNIFLESDETITLEAGTTVYAESDTGALGLKSGKPRKTGGSPQEPVAGTVELEEGATIKADNDIWLETDEVVQAAYQTGKGFQARGITWKKDKDDDEQVITVNNMDDAGTPEVDEGAFFQNLQDIGQVNLISDVIRLESGYDAGRNNLSLQAGTINADGSDVEINVGVFEAWNNEAFTFTHGQSGAVVDTVAEDYSLTVNAEEINIGQGDILFKDFDEVNLNSAGDLTFRGEGGIKAKNEVNLEAARVATSFWKRTEVGFQYEDEDSGIFYKEFSAGALEKDYYFSTDYRIEAGGDIGISGSGGEAGSGVVPGGKLSFDASGGIELKNNALLDVFSGRVSMRAENDVVVGSGSSIFAQGGAVVYDIAGDKVVDVNMGGHVKLESNVGIVDLKDGSEINVSNYFSFDNHDGVDEFGEANEEAVLDQKDVGILADSQVINAGEIEILSLSGAAEVKGNLSGEAVAEGARGGSITLHTQGLDGIADVDGDGSPEFDDLNAMLSDGGFDGDQDFRFRTGDVAINDTVTAESFKLAADSGRIDLYGAIDASGGDGGCVELNSGGDLTLHGDGEGSLIDVSGNEGALGEVRLNASATSGSGSGGRLVMEDGSSIKVGSMAPGDAELEDGKGRVWLRAEREGTGEIKMDLDGEIENAAEVLVEAFRVYQASGWSTGWNSHAQTYIGQADDSGKAIDRLQSELAYADADFRFLPGVEVRSNGDFTLSGKRDVSGWRYNGEPGVLTIRAQEDLTFSGSLIDTASNSWAFNLVAGADTSGADVMTLGTDERLFRVNDEQAIYTKDAPLRFSSSGDMEIGEPARKADLGPYGWGGDVGFRFNIGTASGDIEGHVGGDLVFTSGGDVDFGGAIQNKSGDISLSVGNDLEMNFEGGVSAIRTTGQAPPSIGYHEAPEELQEDFIQDEDTQAQLFFMIFWDFSKPYHLNIWDFPDGYIGDPAYEAALEAATEDLINNYDHWDQWYAPINKKRIDSYQGGGDIVLDVGGRVDSEGLNANTNAWDRYYGDVDYLGPSIYERFATEDAGPASGIVSIAEGDVTVVTGGHFFAQAASFQKGDLRIYSGGNLDGRFQVREGSGEFFAAANFGKGYQLTDDGSFRVVDDEIWTVLDDQAIELYDARFLMTAHGGVEIGTVLNPGIAHPDMYGAKRIQYQYEQTETGEENSRARMIALNGDFYLSGNSVFHVGDVHDNYDEERLLPPDVDIAVSGNLNLENYYFLAPSPTGNLELLVGGDINGEYIFHSEPKKSEIFMSDVDPSRVYNVPQSDLSDSGELGFGETLVDDIIYEKLEHAFVPIHTNDPIPSRIRVGGELDSLSLTLHEVFHINVSQDVRDFFILGQNESPEDVSYLKAGGDIIFASSDGPAGNAGIEMAGPGSLVIQAGGNLELGLTEGIQSIGNLWNFALPTEGAAIYVLAGYYDDEKDIAPNGIDNLFNNLRSVGVAYTRAQTVGENSKVQELLEDLRSNIIESFFEGMQVGSGEIDMISSKISTLSGQDDISIIAGSDINVGTDIEGESDSSKGIYTAYGGNINIFTEKDVNVFESRLMTFMGGDISLWSDHGDINAGRGSKAAVNKEEDTPIRDSDSNIIGYRFTPPSVGSGIRALTFDPDGAQGSQLAPPIGDLYIFAPEGAIDAGEAGISGRNIFLGAQEVRNTQNIVTAGFSLGVSLDTGEAGANIGSLSGAGEVGQATSQLANQNSALESAQRRARTQTEQFEQITPRWLSVEFIGFLRNTDGGGQQTSYYDDSEVDEEEKEKKSS